jgi:hypothetical protein
VHGGLPAIDQNHQADQPDQEDDQPAQGGKVMTCGKTGGLTCEPLKAVGSGATKRRPSSEQPQLIDLSIDLWRN